MRTLRAGVLVALVAVALPAGLWAVSTAGVSPEQRIADAEPPPPPTLEAVLDERVLRDTVVFRGVVVPDGARAVAPPDVADAAPVIVDVRVRQGDVVDAGDVLAVVADRPVIAVPMAIRLHRPLTPGSEGADVERFQGALRRLGYNVAADGRYGTATQAAVRRLYEERGFAPAITGADIDAELRAAEEQLQAAAEMVEDAEHSLRQSRAAGAAGGEEGAGDAETVAEAERAVARARRAHEGAVATRDAMAAHAGTVVPTGEVVAIDAFPAVVSSVDASVGDLAEGPLLHLAALSFVIEARVETTLVPLLSPGVAATVSVGGNEWPAEIASTERDDEGRGLIVLRPDEELPSQALGADARIEAVLAATATPVLAAPVTAIRSDADGEYLRVLEADGSDRRVGISTGVSIGGWVEIASADDTEIGPGTRVRLP